MQQQTRIVIENVLPQLDGGAFAIKRIIGQKVDVTADVFSDGHDVIECQVKYKHEKDKNGSKPACDLQKMTHGLPNLKLINKVLTLISLKVGLIMRSIGNTELNAKFKTTNT